VHFFGIRAHCSLNSVGYSQDGDIGHIYVIEACRQGGRHLSLSAVTGTGAQHTSKFWKISLHGVFHAAQHFRRNGPKPAGHGLQLGDNGSATPGTSGKSVSEGTPLEVLLACIRVMEAHAPAYGLAQAN
jgi:hypothetical protein